MKVPLIIHRKDTGIRFELTEYWQKRISQELTDQENKPIKAYIETVLPESRNQRGYFHALITLWVYLDGGDYRNSRICEVYFEEFKKEFFPEVVKVKGKIVVYGKTSKGNLRKMTEKLLEMLDEEYGVSPTAEVIKPDNYKHFIEEIFSFSEYENYIEYSKSLGWLEFYRIK